VTALRQRVRRLEAAAGRRDLERDCAVMGYAELEELEAVILALTWNLAVEHHMGAEADDLPGLLARTREELGLPNLTMEEAPAVTRDRGEAAWQAVWRRAAGAGP
jgi:hypothetical protein